MMCKYRQFTVTVQTYSRFFIFSGQPAIKRGKNNIRLCFFGKKNYFYRIFAAQTRQKVR